MSANISPALTKWIVATTVTAVAILPRMPFDSRWSIGGNLSRPFRQVLLVLCSYRTFKFVFDGRWSTFPKWLVDLLDGIESTLICFLTLLTPYLLRLWLSEVINVPEGGKGLQYWLYTVASLGFAGIVLELIGFPKDVISFLRRVGDCLTFFPVTGTVALYNSVTHPVGRYPGRGTVLSQIVVIVEWYSLFIHGSDALSKLSHAIGLMVNSSYHSALLKGLRAHTIIASFIRIMCHSIFLNVLDESYQLRNAAVSGEDNRSAHSDHPSRRGSDASIEEMNTLVKLT